jgi:hypothetical protein
MVSHMRHVLAALGDTTDLYRFTSLTNELSAAIDNLLGDVDDEWIETLRNAWFPLEHISAMALGPGQRQLTKNELLGVHEAIQGLQTLLTEYR